MKAAPGQTDDAEERAVDAPSKRPPSRGGGCGAPAVAPKHIRPRGNALTRSRARPARLRSLPQPEAALLGQSLQEQLAATRSLETHRIRRLPPGAASACRPSAGPDSRSRARWWV